MSKKLQFYPYDFAKDGYMKVPPRALNGGLYTGESFYKDAPWGNVPIVPEATIHTNEGIAIGNPNVPKQARFQYHATRPGNSYVEWPGIKKYQGTRENPGPFNHGCYECEIPEKGCNCYDVCPLSGETPACNRNNCVNEKPQESFSKYYYVL
jgi:hypothetical protein